MSNPGFIPPPPPPPTEEENQQNQQHQAQVPNWFATASDLIVKIENASSDEDSKPQCRALWSISHAVGAPFKLFVPFLAQRNFPTVVLDRLVSHLLQQGAEEAAKANASLDSKKAGLLLDTQNGPAHQLMHSVCTYLIALAHTRTALDQNEDLFQLVVAIAWSKPALKVAIETGAFLTPPHAKISNADLTRDSLLGSLIGLNLFKHGTQYGAKVHKLQEYFKFNTFQREFEPKEYVEGESQHHYAIKMHSQRLKNLIEQCVRNSAESREAVLRFINKILDTNRDFKKMQHDPSKLFDPVSLMSLTHACIQLAMPIFGQSSYDPRQISSDYLFDTNEENVFVQIPDPEIVAFQSSAPTKPAVKSTAPYSPKYHLFFLALRCMESIAHPFSEICDSFPNRVHSAMAHRDWRQAQGSALHLGLHQALFSSPELASNMLNFMDRIAEWLVCATGVNKEGDTPDVCPSNWAWMPLHIVDCIYNVTSILCVQMEFRSQAPLADISFYEITNIAGLALLLNGSETLLPKPHSHLNFPDLMVYCFRQHSEPFRNHFWFVTHALRGCIESYIIVESEEYDRGRARFYLGFLMKALLEDTHAVTAVKHLYSEDKQRRLERLTKFMTSEAEFNLNSALKALEEMYKLEKENNNLIPTDNQEYKHKKSEVRRGVDFSKNVMEVFIRLLDHFRQGMAKHLVIQQVGAMLVAFLIRLAGPDSKNLKSASMEECGFKPREISGLIVEAFVRFHDIPEFFRYCVEGTDKIDQFFEAVQTCRRFDVVTGTLLAGLIDMEKKMKEAKETSEKESALYEDPPDDIICSIYSDLLTDPVLLPGMGQESTWCNRETIRHQLIDSPMNPFNRQALTYEELCAFNDEPEQKAKIEEIQKKVAAFKAQRRAENAEKKEKALEKQNEDKVLEEEGEPKK